MSCVLADLIPFGLKARVKSELQLLVIENTTITIRERLLEQWQERLHEKHKDAGGSITPGDNCPICSREHSTISQPSTPRHQTRPHPSPLLHLSLQHLLETGPEAP